MTTRILAVGDIHFRSQDLCYMDPLITKINSTIASKDIDLLVILGDILHYHEKVNSIALNYAVNVLINFSKMVETYVIVGNHDMYSNQVFLQPHHWLNSLKNTPNLKIIDTVETRKFNGKLFAFCPYVMSGRFIEALSTNPSWSDAIVLFAHQEIKGCKMGPFISVDGDEWSEEYPFLVSGHIHDPQQLPNVLYPGSARAVGFGHNSPCRITLLNIGDKIDLCHIPLPHVGGKTMITKDLDSVIVEDDHARLKIIIEDIAQEEIKTVKKSRKYKKLKKSGVKISFRVKDIINPETDLVTDHQDNFLTTLKNLIAEDKIQMEILALILKK